MTENEYIPKHYSILNDIWFFIKYYRENEPIVLAACLVEILLGTLLPLLQIYLPKITLDLVVEGVTVNRVMLVVGGFTVLLVIVQGVGGLVNGGKYYYYNTQRSKRIGMIFLKSLRVKYGYQESGKIKKLYWKALDSEQRGDGCASSIMVTATTGIITSILCFLLYSTVIGTLNVGILLLLVVLALLNYRISMEHIKYEEGLRGESAEAAKHYQCVKNAMGNVTAAKDIRIFAMQGWLLALRDRAIGEVVKVKRKFSGKNTLYECIGFGTSAVRDLAAYGFLIYKAVAGDVTVSEFVLYFGAITGFSGFVEGIMQSLARLRYAANGTDYLRAYLELPEEEVSSGDRHIDELSVPIEIEFRNVSFSYKEKDEDQEEEAEDQGEEAVNQGQQGKQVFRNLNLTIRAGEKIALVGVNGAGKTTFVKLLCGMYDPDEGQILINGIDRNLFPRRELFRLFSIVFQEQLILPFTVLENLSMGKIEEADESRAWEALEKAGLKELFEEKQIHMDSYMTRMMMRNGIKLSGGQQQRFLLARALYKDAPVMVLDEPTAALDPIAESEVYQNYNKYSEGKTAVFISHRLASTRFSDRIILIEDGEFAEMGTHEELMKRNGKYAGMYRLQSSYYAKHKEEGAAFL